MYHKDVESVARNIYARHHCGVAFQYASNNQSYNDMSSPIRSVTWGGSKETKEGGLADILGEWTRESIQSVLIECLAVLAVL